MEKGTHVVPAYLPRCRHVRRRRNLAGLDGTPVSGVVGPVTPYQSCCLACSGRTKETHRKPVTGPKVPLPITLRYWYGPCARLKATAGLACAAITHTVATLFLPSHPPWTKNRSGSRVNGRTCPARSDCSLVLIVLKTLSPLSGFS